ncbi:MAG: hypothetical protein LHV69_03525 [Elusimicrobia bacterium]|nr:hypothetical protein [Candidatus Obscuribacterium magneticum]
MKKIVIPAKAGIQERVKNLDPGFRRGDVRTQQCPPAGEAGYVRTCKKKEENYMKRINRWILLGSFLPLLGGAQLLCADAYDDFNTYCLNNFGAKIEPLVYEKFGNTLQFLLAGDWVHGSETSAAIGFETNLPAKTQVEYWETGGPLQTTALPDRFYYLHLHYLKNLKRNTTYNYRLVATDERNMTIRSDDRTVETKDIAGAIHLPGTGDLSGPPFNLTQANAVYVLTQDVVSQTAGFAISANGITLDMDGHTVIYDDGTPIIKDVEWNYYAYDLRASYGIHTLWNYEDMKFLNGTLKQGRNNGKGNLGHGFGPIFITNNGGVTEVAGITAEYSGDDLAGIAVGADDCNVHHNVIIDRGTHITNRHQALRALSANNTNFPIHHNLIQRARHRAMDPGKDAHSNEIYVDSFATNAFGLGPADGGEYYNNRIFGTGYHVVAIGWASNIHVHDNFIHVQAEAPNDRAGEYGLLSSANGIRLTQYGGGTALYENNLYEGNLIVAKGRNNPTNVKGVQFSSDPNVKNLIFRNNIIRAVAMDAQTTNDTYHVVACVATEGLPEFAALHLPIVFENNRLISNILMVRYMEDYGGGSNQDFKNCTFVREGNNPEFYIFRVGWWYWDTINNDVIDCHYEGDASADSYLFDGSGRRELNFGHFLYVRARDQNAAAIANQQIEIFDMKGNTFTGQTDGSGVARVDLLDYTMFAAIGARTPVRINHSGHYARIPNYYPATLTPEAMAVRDNQSTPYPLTFLSRGSPANPTIVATAGQLDTGHIVRAIGYAFGATAGRIILNDQPDLSAGVRLEQSVLSWTNELLRFTMNRGALALGSAAYLFATDAGGRNSNGFPVVIGQGFSDDVPPYIFISDPANRQISVLSNTNIHLELVDDLPGIDPASIRLFINNQEVTPVITSSPNGYFLDFNPPADLPHGQLIEVRVNSTDLDGNAGTDSISFTVQKAPAYAVILWDAMVRTGSTNWNNSEVECSVRILLEGGRLTNSAGQVALEFQGRSDTRDYQIKGVSIAEAELATGQGHIVDNTWTRVTFDGNLTNTWDADVTTVKSRDTKVSDIINFRIDPSKSYYVTFQIVTMSVFMAIPRDFGELQLSGDQTSRLDWADVGLSADYHAFSRLYGVDSAPPPPGPAPTVGEVGQCINIIKEGVPEAVFNFTLSQESSVKIRIFNNVGLVRTVIDGTLPAGDHGIRWDGKTDKDARAANGTYFTVIELGSYTKTIKVVVLR